MLALVIGLISGTQQAEATDSTYTITIPSTLDVYDSGWNELPGGISASGTLASGKILVITASSDNGFKFVHSDDKTQTVSYDFCASSTDLTPITQWTFNSLSTDSKTQTAGINVEDLTGKLGGTYTEIVTFTALVKNVTLSDITESGSVLQLTFKGGNNTIVISIENSGGSLSCTQYKFNTYNNSTSGVTASLSDDELTINVPGITSYKVTLKLSDNTYNMIQNVTEITAVIVNDVDITSQLSPAA